MKDVFLNQLEERLKLRKEDEKNPDKIELYGRSYLTGVRAELEEIINIYKQHLAEIRELIE